MTWREFFLAASVLLTAGFSDTLGQSAVLFLNRVPPRRFLLCLGSGVLLFVGSAVLWSVEVWLLGLLFGLKLGLGRCLWLVALSHAPQILGMWVLLPHFGSYLFQALRAWTFFNLVVAVGVTTDAPLFTVLLCCVPGWLLHFSLTHLKLWRLERFQIGLWRMLAGRS